MQPASFGSPVRMIWEEWPGTYEILALTMKVVLAWLVIPE